MYLILSKIGKANHIDDMYENEYLFFSNIKNFRSSKPDKAGRLDPKELNVNNQQINRLTLKTEEQEIHFHQVFRDFKAQFHEHLVDPRTHCCSLHWLELELDKDLSSYDDRLLELGEKTLLILDWKRFFEILDKAVSDKDLGVKRKKVTYYDPKELDGEISLFHKQDSFQYQNEYRILVYHLATPSSKLKLSGLKEISAVIETKHLKTLRIKKEKTEPNNTYTQCPAGRYYS
ncbi:MAG: hypothetical protein CMI36_14915 [Owenweeksia sp.]|nr:hypothetical protein [Owenweeksia sp.]MBG00283.1 hypothetical protein [Owenweeksia sp.]HBF21699.1 hypothetical protein [Cryomorphaceae bacterium]|tara:strand:- start:813 stop:1508 length:696 start_codon:yes stop_codon:yes gene_type:complete